ncbi:glutamate receptor 2 isoform X2 [Octopus bimaculoides]|uniref:glutamate receptor 2 isoform X2 n=1 Tax=Octopus bimaculoides TaxID=37653 RepID=UPI00071D4295|nr:glutamate receptor 2 isoform X2 [Octopus bimaculoides]|eukprot:XP_014780672.1 PREDICTED: glutamate receptor 2-like isoform X2 [Octopus bimaculoides]
MAWQTICPLYVDIFLLVAVANITGLWATTAASRNIKIGGIFDTDTLTTAIRYAMRTNVKANHMIIQETVDIIDTSDAYNLSSAICSQSAMGIFALFILNNPISHHVVQAYSNALHLPVFVLNVATRHQLPSYPFEIHMSPSYMPAITELINFYRWRRIFYIFDSDDGLIHLQHIYDSFNNSSDPLEVVVRRVDDIENTHKMLRQLDQLEGATRNIVVVMSSTSAYRRLLHKIMDVGMNKDHYHYILGGLSIAELDLRNFTYGGVTITGFQIVNRNSPSIKQLQHNWNQLNTDLWSGAGQKLSYDEVAIFDSISTLLSALEIMYRDDSNVFSGASGRGRLWNNTNSVHCTPYPLVSWVLGDKIVKAIKQVNFTGLTGTVSFDDNLQRKNVKLDVLQLSYGKPLQNIGEWTDETGLDIRLERPPDMDKTIIEINNTKIMSTIKVPPFLMYKVRHEAGEPLVGNARFEGYVVDLAAKIADQFPMDYIIKIVEDGHYGALTVNGTWNGMMGELTRHEVDLVIAPLTITCMRERAADFSKPFMKTGISIMIKKPDKQKPSVFSFMDPLSQQVWICITIGYVAVSLVLFFVGRFSPYEWHSEDTSRGPKTMNTFNLSNTFWFSLGALMQQGSEISPRSISGRIVGTGWWFFTLIIISSYTANLAAFLTIERLLPPINSAKDLVEQKKIQYGTIKSGSTEEFFQRSQVSIYRRIWDVMSQDTTVFVSNTSKAVERVRNSKGTYAFFLESVMNDYFNQRKPCNTMKVGENLDSKGYGVATPMNSPLRMPINLAVLVLREKGELHKLEKKWWYDKGQCGQPDKESSKTSALRLSNVSGIFHILIAGLVAAMLVALLEYLFHSKMRSRKNKQMAKKAKNVKRARRASMRYTGGYAEPENGGFQTLDAAAQRYSLYKT